MRQQISSSAGGATDGARHSASKDPEASHSARILQQASATTESTRLELAARLHFPCGGRPSGWTAPRRIASSRIVHGSLVCGETTGAPAAVPQSAKEGENVSIAWQEHYERKYKPARVGIHSGRMSTFSVGLGGVFPRGTRRVLTKANPHCADAARVMTRSISAASEERKRTA